MSHPPRNFRAAVVRRAMLLASCLALLCCAAAQASGDEPLFAGKLTVGVPREPLADLGDQTERVNGYAGHFVIGRAGTRRAAMPVYSDTTNSAGWAFAPNVGSELGDDLTMIGGGRLAEYSFSVYNYVLSTAPLTAVDVELRFYDMYCTEPVLIATHNLGTVTFDGGGIAPGDWASVTCDLRSAGIDLPTEVLITQTYSNPVGDGRGTPTEIGSVIFDPPTLGDSDWFFYLDGEWYSL